MSEDPKGSGLDATVSAPGSAGSPSAAARASGSTEAALAPGATLGRYVLVEALGTGGMGMVFRARDPDLGREVAVKVLRASDGGSGGSLERRLLREAQAMATVSHDNLANVYDIGTAGGRVFIAMELLDGGTLRALIADPDKTWRDKLAAVVAAGRGLAAAHSAGVIHRDFKPDNVLVARNGRVKVVDFGLARADRSPATADAVDTRDGRSSGEHALPPDLSAQLTQTGALLGTPAYMAPEQHAGELVDARSDQFAFAVTAWEAVYGQRPFVSDAYSSLVSAVRTHTITPPPKHSGVPAALEAVLRRALSPAPEDRFPTIDAAIAAIERATRRDNSRATMIAIGASALFIGAAVIAVIATRSSSTSTPNRRAKPKDKLAGDIHVTIDPFDMANVGEFSGGPRGTSSDRAVERMAIVGELQHHTSEITDCFASEDIDHGGRVSIEFTIGANGRVSGYRATQDDFADSGLASCVGGKAMRWTFPAPAGGEPVTVTFPFAFSTGPTAPESQPPFDFSSLPMPTFSGPGPDSLEIRIDAGLDEIGDDHYSLPRSVAAAIIAGHALADAARYVPFAVKGKKLGYKLYAIREDSLLDQVGIRDGDLVTALNGIALTSAAAADRAVAAASTADRVEVVLTRAGADEPIALSIDIIPDIETGGPVPPVPPAPPAPAPAPSPSP